MSTLPTRVSASWMWHHPARMMALGLGSGLSPLAPGTVGSLWGWASFVLLQALLQSQHGSAGAQQDWVALLLVGWVLGCWVCGRTARELNTDDPSPVVWDEIWAMWLLLWLMWPLNGIGQLLAFAVFRAFDALKPGPVGWADRLMEGVPAQAIWRLGLGIMLDDLVAAACTLLVMAVVVWVRVHLPMFT